MNVFEKVKGKFQNVQQDLYDGLKALTSLDSQPRHGMLRQLHTDGVNLDAGADLLNKYQNTWKELQDNTVENAQKAENVDCQIGLLFVRWDRQLETMGRLETEVKELPSVLSMISQLTNTLGYVEERCKMLEAALERFEDVCEEELMQRERVSHVLQLANYKRQRNEEVEKIKAQLSKAHTKTMQSIERQRLSKLKEREQVFSEAFSQDINYYQTHGRIEKLTMTNILLPKVSSLSEITLDQDDHDLDKFLESTEAENSQDIPGLSVANIPMPHVSSLTDISIDPDTSGSVLKFLDSTEVDSSQDIPGERKHGNSITEPDGTFFEDDYTANYSVDYSIPSSDDFPDHHQHHKDQLRRDESKDQNLGNASPKCDDASRESMQQDQYKGCKDETKDSEEVGPEDEEPNDGAWREGVQEDEELDQRCTDKTESCEEKLKTVKLASDKMDHDGSGESASNDKERTKEEDSASLKDVKTSNT
ncbi:dysbindin-A-like [Gigantopelta aegis]|uniref:dysbindin-A-like n=1 Tax=Gigantopelta aegis TaxID=1735272 RepID=UPI001B887ECA|nr:dysbindin-A-like [Gigantopelta aegis]